MVISTSVDKSTFLERECRERANIASFPEAIRNIRGLAKFAMRDFGF
jgi:hypothetical protein